MDLKFRYAACGIALSALSAVSLSTNAGEYDLTDFHGKTPTKQEFIERLTPDRNAGSEGSLEFRSIMPGGGTPTKKAVSIQVNFEYDSYRLTPEAKIVLNNLAEAMQDKALKDNRFLIEGHTDAVGSAEYNQSLSARRAESVRNFLASSLGVDANRLKTTGRGEEELLDKGHPGSGVNRRVQVVNLQ
ncbi:MAG: OmpA family protein [Gammaproteobacteria bacterium]